MKLFKNNNSNGIISIDFSKINLYSNYTITEINNKKSQVFFGYLIVISLNIFFSERKKIYN